MKKEIIIVLLVSVFLISCSKSEDNSKSTWKVEEWCTPKVSGVVGCQTHVQTQKEFYNKDIVGVQVGSIVMYHEDSNVKEYRKFLQKL